MGAAGGAEAGEGLMEAEREAGGGVRDGGGEGLRKRESRGGVSRSSSDDVQGGKGGGDEGQVG